MRAGHAERLRGHEGGKGPMSLLRHSSQVERIAALETRLDALDKVLEATAAQVKEIHGLLLGARAILWSVGRTLAWVGGPSVFGLISYTIWRIFHA